MRDSNEQTMFALRKHQRAPIGPSRVGNRCALVPFAVSLQGLRKAVLGHQPQNDFRYRRGRRNVFYRAAPMVGQQSHRAARRLFSTFACCWDLA
jgi:hypothetical protein